VKEWAHVKHTWTVGGSVLLKYFNYEDQGSKLYIFT